MLYLTIFNTLLVIYLLINTKLKISFRSDKTIFKNTLVGFRVTLWKRVMNHSIGIYTLYIPIRNKRKVELAEEVKNLISHPTNTIFNLNTKFSWLKTLEQVKQFEKDYSIVDKALVESLVENFVPKE